MDRKAQRCCSDGDVDEEERRQVGWGEKGGGNPPNYREFTNKTSQGVERSLSQSLKPCEEGDDDNEDDLREVHRIVDVNDTFDYEDEEVEYDRVSAGTIMGTNEQLLMNRVGSCCAGWQRSNPMPTSFPEWRRSNLQDCSTNYEAILARPQDDREPSLRAKIKELETAK